MSKPVHEIKPEKNKNADYRDLGPIWVCPCGSDTWKVISKFDDDGMIALWFTDMTCVLCDSLAKSPTPEDVHGK